MQKYAKVVNMETGECEVGLGTDAKYYQSIGMTLQDVCQSNGNWYLTELCPPDPELDYKELRQKAYLAEMPYGDQLDSILKGFVRIRDEGMPLTTDLHDIIDTWQAIKLKYPKPE